MFQYEFFDMKAYKVCSAEKGNTVERAGDRVINRRLQDCNFGGALTLDDVELVRSSYWAEHCLECGEPACYETCEHFVRRADGRCKRFSFGIASLVPPRVSMDAAGTEAAAGARHDVVADAAADVQHDAVASASSGQPSAFPYAAEVQFRQWGKMETIVRDGVLDPASFVALHDEWRDKCADAAKRMVGLFSKRRYSIEERQQFDSAKYVASETAGNPDKNATPEFVLQCCSLESEPFELFFEITDDDELVYRESVKLEPGFNQTVFDVASVFPGKGTLRAKMYPAEDREACVVFLMCEFVKLKPGRDAAGVGDAATVADAAAGAAMPSPAEPKPAKKVKCVAWDLDNTTWGGVLIESDPDELELLPGVLDTIKMLDERGIIQIVLSKNDEDDVKPVLDRLGLTQYYVGIYANWSSKSSNLQAAASDINIGIDTFALVDDSVFERNEVHETLPMVRVYENTVVLDRDGMPELLGLPEFDVPVTADSKKRREMYQTENLRKKAAGGAGVDNIGFLRSCQIRVELGTPGTPEKLKRSHELLQRTNQLNLSGSRYDFDTFMQHIGDPGTVCLSAVCSDRFGTYGQVMYMECHVEKNQIVVSEFAMSCRVAGKCIEAALSAALLDHFAGNGAAGGGADAGGAGVDSAVGGTIESIVMRGTRTARNGLLCRTFTAAGYSDESTEGDISLVLRSRKDLVNADVVAITIAE